MQFLTQRIFSFKRYGYILPVVLLFLISVKVEGQIGPSAGQNFIYSRTILKEGVKTQADLNALTGNDVRADVQYVDGLGRPLQNISVQAAPDGKDIVTPIAYDAYGRQDKGYLPYAAAGMSGAFRGSGLTEQAAFYATAQTSIPAIPNPYSQTVFEPSPLNRVMEVAAPGQSWAIGSGHTVTSGYEINTAGDQVRFWNIQYNGTTNTGATSSGYYPAGQLYKSTTKDEQQNLVIEYKDKEGQVVCKKVQDAGTEQAPGFMVTQYVYDDFNQLAYVIPPALESITSFTESDQNFSNYIYAYHYDGRLRLIEKKIPGKGWEYTVYNATDRPVYTSDNEQRNRGVWSFVKYDALGRTIMTGEATIASSTTRADLQNTINNTLKPVGATDLYETYTGFGGSNNMGYSNTTLPNANFKIFTVSYYDDYAILTSLSSPYNTWFAQPNGTPNESQRTKGLPTVTAVNILGTSIYLYTATYYTDDKARVSKVVKQHQLNGVDVITNTYNFLGELTVSTRMHYNNSNIATPVVTVTTANQYDHSGRIIQTQETINSQQPVTTSYTYNAVGQLERKSVGGQDIDYQYNARGWMTKQSAALFTQELKYDDASQNPQFNGNIAQQLWTTNGQNHNYDYTYDKANRLLSGISDENNNETLNYDKMGNTTSLYRQGTAAITTGLGMLSYTYSGNQLQGVSGGYNKSYTYNSNGSMTGDGTLGFQYNELNLPKQVSGTPVGTVTYIYDAGGAKLTKQTVNETRQYIDGIEYAGGSIDLLHMADGLARNSGGTYNYEFFLSDHLGNTRVVHNGAGTVYQRTDYMPFGMEIARNVYNPNKYLYNGKEKQEELNQYDYGARFYDAVIGRWHVVDPLVEKYASVSPYNFATNNPIVVIDFNGADTTLPVVGGGEVNLPFSVNSVETYNSGQSYSAYGKAVPVVAGQLRGFHDSNLGNFNARWTRDENGNLVFAGYKNDQNQTYNEAVVDYNNKVALDDLVGKVNSWLSDPFNQLMMVAGGLQMQEAIFSKMSVSASPRAALAEVAEQGAAKEVMNPWEINFMQSSIKNATGEFTVLGNAQALKSGALNPEVLRMNVWKDAAGKVWTLDHRRLAAFRLSGLQEAPIQWANPSGQMWKMTTTNGGSSIWLKFGGGNGVTVR